MLVTDVGLKGSVVEVDKRLFRNILYPAGDAVYASPENLEDYEKYRKVSPHRIKLRDISLQSLRPASELKEIK